MAVEGHAGLDGAGAGTPDLVGDVLEACLAHAAGQRREPFAFEQVGRVLLLGDSMDEDDRGHRTILR